MTTPIFSLNDNKRANLLKEIDEYNWLISYFYLKQFQGDTLVEKVVNLGWDRDKGDYFLLDSGAFSAWRQGQEISLFEYIDVLKEIQDQITHAVCLDVIDDPITSEANHLIMIDAGRKNVIPVYHSGARTKLAMAEMPSCLERSSLYS